MFITAVERAYGVVALMDQRVVDLTSTEPCPMTRFHCDVNRLLVLSVEARSCANVISTNMTLEREAEMAEGWRFNG
jgi:hypothetical protein